MKSHSSSDNPLNMVPDPFAGDTFILSETLCTPERRAWFRRSNEILAFQMVTALALKECAETYQKMTTRLPFKEKTPIELN